MKLLVSWIRELGRYVSREFHFTMRDLIGIHGWRHVEPWVLTQCSQSPQDKLIELCGALPDYVLFWESYGLVNAIAPALKAMGCRMDIFIDDLHLLWGAESEREDRLRALLSCDRVLTPYAYVFDDFYPELRGQKEVHWVPHAASSDFVLPLNETPKGKILLSGFVGAPYPLRTRMKQLMEQGWDAIEQLEHPGYFEDYDYANDPRVGPGYAATIHQYLAGFTDAAIYRYVVAKHFEIPATGALLVTDSVVEEPLRELGFIEGVHYIATTLETLEDKIRYVLDERNREEMNSIRRNGQALVLSTHCTQHRSQLLDSLASRGTTASDCRSRLHATKLDDISASTAETKKV
ncbi:glycosyltransferase family protein [Acidicapsa acidisoli]|uniref:glycosyltransferase family protein n=1 Tax=Acidicapsa acidisoli TaxID=1615681 RepID=UPI0021DFF334|nr:glycosyltransferase [Acidicapsa acidisoli]